MTKTKNISIITNFGCNSNCWYCVWKKHKLNKITGPTDWNNIESFLTKYKEKGKVSISGGGDPLYNFDNNTEWWNRLFEITNNLNIKIDLHTRVKLYNSEFFSKINRLSYSSDILDDDIEYLNFVKELVKLRLVYVATNKTTYQIIDDYVKYVHTNDCQLTIKQLVQFDDNGMFEKIKNRYENVYCLRTDDYNIYLMPDGYEYDIFIL